MKEINVGGAVKAPVKQPVITRPRKESFFSKMIGVVVDDIKSIIFRKEVLIGETPNGWEDYQRFCELARKK